MASLEEIRQVRLEKLRFLISKGITPYPATARQDITCGAAVVRFDELAESGKSLYMVGRIRSLRAQGKVIFFDLDDGTGRFQALLKKGEPISEESYELFERAFDIGDFVEVKGTFFLTKRDEKTMLVEEVRMLAKSLRPLPEKWHGLSDHETRFRQRYLDILFNPESREIVKKRSVFWNAVREFHTSHGFLEVETPVLENIVGGGDATPFKTHHNALDMDVYLRISAGELWQKRLMVAGIPKTFEIGRIFRNEGMSPEHLQDYTQCEAYWAYADYKDMYKFLRECYLYVAKETFGTLQFKINSFDIDLNQDWPLLDYRGEVKKQTGIDIEKPVTKK